jgi:sugar lactone lactonase YvrE
MRQVDRSEVEVLASGYRLAEAPRVAEDGSIFHTDAMGGGVYRWHEGQCEEVIPKRRGVGGLALHADGGVIIGGRDLLHVAPNGIQRTVWVLPDGVVGLNDLCALADGSVLVGALRWSFITDEADGERTPGEFWRIGPAGERPAVVIPGIVWVNGCGVDLDRGRTYACDYDSGTVWVLDSDGVRMFAEVPGGEADGLAVDHEGGVWVATAKGGTVVRLHPDDGSVIDGLAVGGTVTSVAFDGADQMVLTTAATSRDDLGALLRLPAPVPGPRHLVATI